MNLIWDTIIVGAGLAGACAALYLSRSRSVLVLEAEHPAAGASGAAAGLVNPVMGRRARLAWRAGEALDALEETLDLAEARSLFRRDGVLRPAADDDQACRFREAARRYPEHGHWLPPEAVRERCPEVAAAHGALLVRRGGAVRAPLLVEALLQAATRQGATLRTGVRVVGWDETDTTARVVTGEGEAFAARNVILALGYGFRRHSELADLPLHGVKGQVVEVATPPALKHLALPLSGQGYVVPDGDTLVVGSSYEHRFTDLRPSPRQTQQILRKAARMLPGIEEAGLVGETAGVRVTVPRKRLPVLSPVPGRSRIWIFSGLGSKGLLMAPLVARSLPRFLEAPDTIPPELRLPRP